MHKLGIIGLGNVGSTLANNLVQSGAVDELVLIDKREDKLLADRLDLEDSFAASGHFVTIRTNDYTALSNAEILVISVGDIKAYFGDNPDRWVELEINRKNIKDIAENLKTSAFSGIIIVISNPCDAITTLLQKELDYPKEKIFGTGTLLDTSRLKRQLWQETGINPTLYQVMCLVSMGIRSLSLGRQLIRFCCLVLSLSALKRAYAKAVRQSLMASATPTLPSLNAVNS